MISLQEVCRVLSQIAPLRLAESWDNVGLLVGNRDRSISRILTCLTITPDVVQEAIDQQVDLIVAHHPLPFKSLQRITSDSTTGKMLLQLIAADVAIYSAHTAFDSAQDGINQLWADRLQLVDIQPLVEPTDSTSEGNGTALEGSGRIGSVSADMTLQQLARSAADAVGAQAPRMVGDPSQSVGRIAMACGSGGSFLAAAKRRGCHAMITGEATFHTCLEAESIGIGLVLLGHYWSERFAMEVLAERLGAEFAAIEVWASRNEHDPIMAVPEKH